VTGATKTQIGVLTRRPLSGRTPPDPGWLSADEIMRPRLEVPRVMTLALGGVIVEHLAAQTLFVL
jgi:hypothetical protein